MNCNWTRRPGARWISGCRFICKLTGKQVSWFKFCPFCGNPITTITDPK